MANGNTGQVLKSGEALKSLPYDLGVYIQQYPWVLGETLCKLRALGSEMSSYTSVLTIVAFSTERYLAICQPIQSYTTSSAQLAVRIIALLWIISLLSATPFAIFTTVNYIDYPPGSKRKIPESAFCAMLERPSWPMCELSAFIFFLAPMMIIMVLYTLMGLTIRSRSRKFPGETKHLDSRTKPIIRMLAAVVVTFFLCWAPFHMQRLFFIYGKDSPQYDVINEWAYYITGCFYYFSCTVNPVLYNVMSAKYRYAFRKTLCCREGEGTSREQSTFRDTTVVYVNSHVERCRSITSTGHNNSRRGFRLSSCRSKGKNNGNNVAINNTTDEKQRYSCCYETVPTSTSNIVVSVKPTSNGKNSTFSTTTKSSWSKNIFKKQESEILSPEAVPLSDNHQEDLEDCRTKHPHKNNSETCI